MLGAGSRLLRKTLSNKTTISCFVNSLTQNAFRTPLNTCAVRYYNAPPEQKIEADPEIQKALKRELKLSKLRKIAEEKERKMREKQLLREKKRAEEERKALELAKERELKRQALLKVKRLKQKEEERLRRRKEQQKLKEWKKKQLKETLKVEKPKKKEKDINAPTRARNAFVFYYSQRFPTLKAEYFNQQFEAAKASNPELTEEKFKAQFKVKVPELMRKAKEEFENLPQDQKDAFNKLAEQDKLRYQKDVAAYKRVIERRKPKRPLSPYLRFVKENFAAKKEQMKDAKVTEIAKALGEDWKALPEEQKEKYIQEYKKEVAELDRKQQEEFEKKVARATIEDLEEEDEEEFS